MASFKPDRRAIGKILVAAEVRAVLLAKAETGKTIAESIAPRDITDTDGEYFNEHFGVREGTQERGTVRAFAEIYNDHSAAISIEYGTGDPNGSRTPAHHTLLRTVEAMKE
jgi:hypothetical protein